MRASGPADQSVALGARVTPRASSFFFCSSFSASHPGAKKAGWQKLDDIPAPLKLPIATVAPDFIQWPLCLFLGCTTPTAALVSSRSQHGEMVVYTWWAELSRGAMHSKKYPSLGTASKGHERATRAFDLTHPQWHAAKQTKQNGLD